MHACVCLCTCVPGVRGVRDVRGVRVHVCVCV